MHLMIPASASGHLQIVDSTIYPQGYLFGQNPKQTLPNAAFFYLSDQGLLERQLRPRTLTAVFST